LRVRLRRTFDEITPQGIRGRSTPYDFREIDINENVAHRVFTSLR